MRRTILTGCAAVLWSATVVQANAGDLALKRVMLSSGGVGYFEYSAEVDGPAALGLDVKLDQVDDVLKSLVVFDSAGGVGGIELPGRDQSHTAFGDVPFGPDTLNSPLDFLNSLQGVELEVQGPRPMSGRLLHADTVREPAAPGRDGAPRTADRTRVSVMTVDGLRQFVLEDAEAVQVADPALRERVGRALAAMRQDVGQDVRHLTIRASGNGQRTIRVGFVAVAPLWKASYRLMLPAEAGANGRMQGWATLENVSGVDWAGVELSLQYGNPVTFHQAIYRSYFVARPDVPVEVLGRLLPDVDTAARPEPPGDAMPAGSAAKQTRAMSMPAAAAPLALQPPAAPAPVMMEQMALPERPVQVAEGGEETVFRIAVPVTLAAGHTSSVPILDAEIPAERIDLALPDQAHPLAAVRVRNSGDTSLPAGVLTLYDQTGAAQYVGDARLGGLPRGESRLLSFAQDLRTTLEWNRASAVTIASLTAAAGVLRIEERERQTIKVILTAPATEPRVVLVEIAKGRDQSVAADGPQPVEETATAWRFAQTLKVGETRTLSVAVDRLRRQSAGLLTDTATIARVLNEQGLSDAARKELARLADLRAQEAARAGEHDLLRAQIDDVEKDEARLRDNLGALTSGDALRTRLVRQLDADETRIAQLQQAADQTGQALDRAHRALVEAVGTLRI